MSFGKEFVLLVAEDRDAIVPVGGMLRAFIHNGRRIPHASVLLLPRDVLTGEVMLYRRSATRDVSPGCWDVCGGHVQFDRRVIDGDMVMADYLLLEARREGCEELGDALCGLRQLGGCWSLKLESENNLEYATAYVADVDPVRVASIGDDAGAPLLRGRYSDLRQRWQSGELACALGADAIFRAWEECPSEEPCDK